MKQELKKLVASAKEAAKSAADLAALEAARKSLLGRKGEMTALLRGLSGLADDERRKLGALANRAKQEAEALFSKREQEIEREQADAVADSEWIDVTEDRPGPPRGTLHPLTRTRYELEDIFVSMGFTVLDGPELESEHYNFEALNIPSWHPAREMQDTFWTETGLVPRTQTSSMQVRAMERYGAPLRVVVPGRTFRQEATDASHDHTFDQFEGLMIDRDISIANLVGTMNVFLERVFGEQIKTRLRPGYFPFVEPGFELDAQCVLCDGAGCPTCKRTGWVEMLGCGLVHPNVLRAGGLDPEQWSGFAFGLGTTRLVMMRHGIDDIRLLTGGDPRFLEQFAA